MRSASASDAWRLGLAVAFVATTLPFVYFDRDWWALTGYFALFATIAVIAALYNPKDVAERGTLRADSSGLTSGARRFDVAAIRRARIRRTRRSPS